ncbi:MAG: LysM domain-containing protein, partial [Pseudomonadota bacterium]
MQLPSIQLRYVLPAAAFALAVGVVATVLNFSGGEAALDPETVEHVEPTIADIITAQDMVLGPPEPVEQDPGVIQVAMQAPAKPVYREEVMVVSSGDTLMDIAVRAGAPGDQAYAAIARLAEAFDPRRLQVGQEITLQLEETAETTQLTAMGLRPDVASEVWVTADP